MCRTKIDPSQYYKFVMLSNYLKNGRAHFNPHIQQISLSYSDEELHIDVLHPQYQQIKVLSLTHCSMRTLEGIEQFQELQELNIRCNSIMDVDELFRIYNKECIQRLEFVGNDIEYLGAALFINLRPYFPNLIELNGKNYYSIIHKHSDKRHQMKRIVAHSHQLQKEMMKTLRKEDRRTKELRRTEERAIRTDNYYSTHPEDDEEDNIPSKSRELLATSKRQRSGKQQQSPSPSSRPSPSPHRQEQQKENHNNSNQQDYDVSLGDISNIPMTKSIRGSFIPLSNDNKQKRKGLQIFTLNESIHNNRAALSQPTATFAMQRQKENQQPIGFMFRNREKTQKYKPSGLPIEECALKEEYERPTKRETYQSISDEMNQSWASSFSEDNIIHEDKTNNQIKKMQIAGALFTKNLMEKVFYSWRTLPGDKNFPMKRQFM